MCFRHAKKLENRDEVEVRKTTGGWEHGYVLGSPKVMDKIIIIPVQTPSDGFREVSHFDVR